MDEGFEALLEHIKQGQNPPQEVAGARLSNYDKFLESLLKGKHPPYCELVWNGEAFHIVLFIHFQKGPQIVQQPGPEGEAYRREAYRRFRKIGPIEQTMVAIRVTIKNYLPVMAEVAVRPEAVGLLRLNTGQLMELQNP